MNAFDTNLSGAWRTAKAFVLLLKISPQRRIVNVSSGAGSFSDFGFGLAVHRGRVPFYGLTGLTVKLAVDLENTTIKANPPCPGFVDSYPCTEVVGARPVAAGAKGIAWAATLQDNVPSGKCFRDGKKIQW